MGYSKDGQMTSGYSNAIDQLAKSYTEATAEANALKMAQDGLSESTVNDILVKQNWSQSEREAVMNSQAFMAAQASATIATNSDTSATWANVVATKAMSVAKKAVSILGGVALSAAISLGITALIKFGDALYTSKKELEEASESAKKNIDTIKESFDNLETTTNSIKDRYAELAQGVDQLTGKNFKLSNNDYDEFLTLSNQLAELFPTLTKNYDENGNAILDLSGNVDGIVSSLDDLIERQRQLANKEMLENLPDVYKNYERQVEGYSKQLEEAKKKQANYLNIYNQLKKATYETSEDKKTVTFNLGNIDEQTKADMVAELTSSIEDINDYIVQDIGTIGNYDTMVTLYLNEEFDGFEARLKSAQEEIQKYTSQIESEVSSFSTYMNTWLQGSWAYQQQDDTMQTALQQVLFNKDWIDIAKSELGKDAEWEDIAKWIEENYIEAINSINDAEIKQDFIDLFTTDLTPQDTINLAQKIQDYFNEHNILVSLDFILDETDPSSTTNLVDRFNSAIAYNGRYSKDEIEYLHTYTEGFTEQQMQTWMEVTSGVFGATKAVQEYENYINGLSQKEYVDFFDESNLEKVDAYKQKISDLGSYLSNINTNHKLTAEEISVLNTEYGIVADSVEGYRLAIINMMNDTAFSGEIMTALAEAIETCNDETKKERLQSLYSTLQNINVEAQQSADAFGNLDTAISTLQSRADLLRDVRSGMNEFGYIDSSKLDDIISAYPQLESKVAEFNAGLITSSELFDALESAYAKDQKKYAELITQKLQYSSEFYETFLTKMPEWLSALAQSYDIDFNNFKNLCEAKLALQKELVTKQAKLDVARTIVDNLHDDDPSNDYMYLTEKDANDQFDPNKNLVESKKQVSDIEAIINGIDTVLGTSLDLDTSWENFGDSKTKIDWVDQSLSVLQEAVDDAQTALENTKGLDAQIAAIDVLNGVLGELKSGYKKAYKSYSTRYTEGLQKLSNPTEIQRKIESGESFKLKEYSSEDAKIIQELIDLYAKMKDAEDKMAELGTQIDDNENLEKPKVRQANYESLLENVQAKLEDQTLSTSERNDLLKDQLLYQQAINEELAKQAEYEGDEEGAAALRKKNEILEQEADKDIYNTSKDERSSYINDNENKIKDIQNKIDLNGGIGTTQDYEDIKNLNKSNAEYWEQQRLAAEEMLEDCTKGTKEWDDWNTEIQNCEDNINACEKEIKSCELSILKLPLNDIELKLMFIENQLNDINEMIDYNNQYIAAASFLIDKEVRSHEKVKESIQDQIDALEKANNVRKSSLALQQSEYNLRRSMEQKSAKVKINAYYYSNVIYESNYIG